MFVLDAAVHLTGHVPHSHTQRSVNSPCKWHQSVGGPQIPATAVHWVWVFAWALRPVSSLSYLRWPRWHTQQQRHEASRNPRRHKQKRETSCSVCVCAVETLCLLAQRIFYFYLNAAVIGWRDFALTLICVASSENVQQLSFYFTSSVLRITRLQSRFLFFFSLRIFVWSGCVQLARLTKPALSCTSSRNECRHAFRLQGKKGHKADLFVLLILRTPTARQTHLQLSCRHSAHDSLMTCPERKKNGRL